MFNNSKMLKFLKDNREAILAYAYENFEDSMLSYLDTMDRSCANKTKTTTFVYVLPNGDDFLYDSIIEDDDAAFPEGTFVIFKFPNVTDFKFTELDFFDNVSNSVYIKYADWCESNAISESIESFKLFSEVDYKMVVGDMLLDLFNNLVCCEVDDVFDDIVKKLETNIIK